MAAGSTCSASLLPQAIMWIRSMLCLLNVMFISPFLQIIHLQWFLLFAFTPISHPPSGIDYGCISLILYVASVGMSFISSIPRGQWNKSKYLHPPSSSPALQNRLSKLKTVKFVSLEVERGWIWFGNFLHRVCPLVSKESHPKDCSTELECVLDWAEVQTFILIQWSKTKTVWFRNVKTLYFFSQVFQSQCISSLSFPWKKLNICIWSIFLCNLAYRGSKSLNFIITGFCTGQEFPILSLVEKTLLIALIIDHHSFRWWNLTLERCSDLPEVLKIGPVFWRRRVSWDFGTETRSSATNTIQIHQ